MSSNNSSASASVAANQALISLLARLEVLIQQVLQASSEEEKMALSRTIAREVVSIYFYLSFLYLASTNVYRIMAFMRTARLPPLFPLGFCPSRPSSSALRGAHRH
jgi:hypothetical protein